MAIRHTTAGTTRNECSFWVAPEELTSDQNIRPIDPEYLESLVASIRDHGQQVPIKCRRDEQKKLVVVAGNHRLAAIKQLAASGLPIKAWVAVDLGINTPKDIIVAQVLENLRKDLNDVEEAKVNEQLLTTHGLTLTEVSKLYGRSNTNRASQLLKLLTLPEALQQLVATGKVSLTAALATGGDQGRVDAVVAKANAGGSVTAVEAAGPEDADDAKPLPKKTVKHLQDFLDRLGDDKTTPTDERILGLLEKVCKYLRGGCGEKALLNSIENVEEGLR